jgi:hypothetical protein
MPETWNTFQQRARARMRGGTNSIKGFNRKAIEIYSSHLNFMLPKTLKYVILVSELIAMKNDLKKVEKLCVFSL